VKVHYLTESCELACTTSAYKSATHDSCALLQAAGRREKDLWWLVFWLCMRHTAAQVHPLGEGVEEQHGSTASARMPSTAATIGYIPNEETARPANIFQRGWDAYVNGLGAGLSSFCKPPVAQGRTHTTQLKFSQVPPMPWAEATAAVALNCVRGL
jgi:hypothetical protein